MSKKKYIYSFNRHSLSYDKIKKSVREKIFTGSAWFMVILLVSILLNLSFSYIWEMPVEKAIRHENEQLQKQYELLEENLTKAKIVLEDIRQRDMNIYKSIFDADPFYRTSKSLDQVKSHLLRKKDMEDIVFETYRSIGELSIRVDEQFKFMDNVKQSARKNKDKWAFVPAIQPIDNPDLKRTAAGYGWKIHPIYKIKKFHKGIDFTAPRGTLVKATATGVVVEINNVDRGHGRRIVIEHDMGYSTVYAHLEQIKVRRGQQVERGQIIASVGSSGMTLVPHLHYEVIKDGRNVNPVNYFFLDLKSEEFKEIIELAANHGQSFD
jgi:murein DD-endopeptidase MepM/ murein hydrolase activator NlpD